MTRKPALLSRPGLDRPWLTIWPYGEPSEDVCVPKTRPDALSWRFALACAA